MGIAHHMSCFLNYSMRDSMGLTSRMHTKRFNKLEALTEKETEKRVTVYADSKTGKEKV